LEEEALDTTIAQERKEASKRFGSPLGLIAVFILGLALYFLLGAIQGGNTIIMDYNQVIANIKERSGLFYWFFMNFTEPNFIGGLFSSILILAGGFVSWLLCLKGSKYAGFEICYGATHIWPWVLFSQVLSLLITMFVCNYMSLFDKGLSWIPTFITIVSVPPAIVLLYGPSVPALLTGAILGGIFCTPAAYWLSQILAPWNIPGVVANVGAMAIVGWAAATVCHVLPWMKKVELKPNKAMAGRKEDVYSPLWLVRRTIAEFSEPLFYGSEVVGIFFTVGIVIDWLLSPRLLTGGAMAVPAILLSQIVAGGVGIFLYADQWEKKGWYPTYVPVVSCSPACVLMFGATIPVALFAGIVGGIIGAPIADHIGGRMASYIHGTVANVTSMALCSILLAIVMQILPWF
jgi:hypothetical protein